MRTEHLAWQCTTSRSVKLKEEDKEEHGFKSKFVTGEKRKRKSVAKIDQEGEKSLKTKGENR